MSIKTLILIALGFSGVVLATMAAAGPTGDRAATAMTRMDADGDGMITREEFDAAEPPGNRHGRSAHPRRPSEPIEGTNEPARAEQMASRQIALFEALDGDGDGCLSQDEFSQHHEVRQTMFKAHLFERLDANGDGVVTEDELSSARRGPPQG